MFNNLLAEYQNSNDNTDNIDNGVTNCNNNSNDSDNSGSNSSKTMEFLSNIFPMLLDTYIPITATIITNTTNTNTHNTPNTATTATIRDVVVKELCMRVVHYYISISALARKNHIGNSSGNSGSSDGSDGGDSSVNTGEVTHTNTHTNSTNTHLLSSDLCIKDCTALDLLMTTCCSGWKLAVPVGRGSSSNSCSNKYNAVAMEFM